MTKAHEQRVKQSLERTRLKLKGESAELEQRRREYGREREAAIAALRILCGTYGDNDWPDDLPIADILQQHLAGRLEHQLRTAGELLREKQHELAEVIRAQATPRTPVLQLPPRAMEAGAHQIRLVPVAEGRLGQGYRAQCLCRWQTGVCSSSAYAQQLGEDHVIVAVRQEGQAGRRASR